MTLFGATKYVKNVPCRAAQATWPIRLIFSVIISPTVVTMHDISKVSKPKALVLIYPKIWSKLAKIQKYVSRAVQNAPLDQSSPKLAVNEAFGCQWCTNFQILKILITQPKFWQNRKTRYGFIGVKPNCVCKAVKHIFQPICTKLRQNYVWALQSMPLQRFCNSFKNNASRSKMPRYLKNG